MYLKNIYILITKMYGNHFVLIYILYKFIIFIIISSVHKLDLFHVSLCHKGNAIWDSNSRVVHEFIIHS